MLWRGQVLSGLIQGEMKLVSIITPCFNRSELLKEALFSISNQTYRSVEVVVVDDGSSPEQLMKIRDVISIFPFARLVLRDRAPKGAATCRNIGVAHSRGDWIQFLDSDDLLHSHKLERQMLVAGNNDLVVGDGESFLHCVDNVIHYWPNGGSDRKSWRPDDWIESFLNRRFVWTTAAPVIRKSLLNAMGLMPEQLVCCQDWDLFLHALCHSPRIAIPNDSAIAYYRENEDDERMKLKWSRAQQRKAQLVSREVGFRRMKSFGFDSSRNRMYLASYFSALGDKLQMDGLWMLAARARWNQCRLVPSKRQSLGAFLKILKIIFSIGNHDKSENK